MAPPLNTNNSPPGRQTSQHRQADLSTSLSLSLSLSVSLSLPLSLPLSPSLPPLGLRYFPQNVFLCGTLSLMGRRGGGEERERERGLLIIK